MSQLTHVIFVNAVLATVLAMGIVLIQRSVKEPIFRHILWVLVLARLLMPPVLTLEASGWEVWWARQISTEPVQKTWSSVTPSIFDRDQCFVAFCKTFISPHILPCPDLWARDDSSRRVMTAESTIFHTADVVSLSQDLRQAILRGLVILKEYQVTATRWLLIVWGLGTTMMLILQLIKTRRFRRQIERKGYPSRIWQARTDKLAHRMGLDSCPEVWLVRAQISPMLWGIGRHAKLLFPVGLVDQLDPGAQDTLLVHELAHYRRGDQWVRLVEMIATALFWWHPVLWWTKRELEEAEEACCDAWAVSMTQGSPRKYAEALLATVDFVSLTHYSIQIPPTACGVSCRLLRQRLHRIMGLESFARSLSRDSYLFMAFLSILVLVPFPTYRIADTQLLHTLMDPCPWEQNDLGLFLDQEQEGTIE